MDGVAPGEVARLNGRRMSSPEALDRVLDAARGLGRSVGRLLAFIPLVDAAALDSDPL